MYKIHSACLLSLLQRAERAWQRIHPMQRGAKQGSSGVIENNLINRWILEDAKCKKRNLSMAWIDFKKAFDMVKHSWIERILQVSGYPTNISRAIINMMHQWSTQIELADGKGKVKSNKIQFRRGIIQGDSLSPFIFCLCTSPLSNLIERFSKGYTPGDRRTNSITVTHCYYMDDLKIYTKGPGELQSTITMISESFKAIGFEVNVSKSGYLHLQSGRESISPVCKIDQTDLPCCNASRGGYKYLGIIESDAVDKIENISRLIVKVRKSTTMLARAHVNANNFSKLINMCVIPKIEYISHVVDFSDIQIKHVTKAMVDELTESGFHRSTANKSRLFIPRKHGGRGIISPRLAIARACIRRLIILLCSDDAYIRAIRESKSATWKSTVSQFSTTLKRVNLSAEVGESHLRINDIEIALDNIKSAHLQAMTQYTNASIDKKIQKLSALVLHGSYSRLLRDQDICMMNASHFLLEGKMDRQTESIVAAAMDTAIPFRWYVHNILKQPTQTTCRMCGNTNETIEHILSGCQVISFTQYLERHNKMLSHVYYHLRDQINDTCVTGNQKMIRTIRTASVDLFWDSIIETAPIVPGCKPDMLWKDDRSILIIEGAITTNSKIKDKYNEKLAKYQPLASALKHMYPNHKISILPIIMGTLGAYEDRIVTNLQLLPGSTKVKSRQLVSHMQSTVVYESAKILKRALAFK